MSTWTESSVTCPSCAVSTSMHVATSVHITRVPEVRVAVLDRSLHRSVCTCGQRIVIDVAFTYVDVERGHWLQVEPVRRRPEWRTVEADAMRALARSLDLTSPIISGLAESARRRVVFGLEELREKLIVWDAGIDDGLLECIKLRAWIDEPSLMRTPLIAERVTDDGRLELVKIDEQPARRFAVSASTVDRALDEQPSLESRYPELFGGGFVNALRLIAMVLVVVAGCSQPPTRDTQTPRAKDAAVAVVDDAAIDDPPADATVPDAGKHKVLWQMMRNRDTSAAAIVVAAYVANVRSDGHGDQTMIVLDRGKHEGVQVGWKGRLLNYENERVFDVFEITSVAHHHCQARVTASSDEVASTPRHAVLWDPNAGSEP